MIKAFSASTALARPEPMLIGLRAYTASEKSERLVNVIRPGFGPSDWTLIFDCETSTDDAQRLRFGAYQVRKGHRLHEQGLFYEPGALTQDEVDLLARWATANDMRLLTRADFVEEVFFPIGYDRHAMIVGMNLPFDISRIAISHGSARGKMRGGFSFQLSPSTQASSRAGQASFLSCSAYPVHAPRRTANASRDAQAQHSRCNRIAASLWTSRRWLLH